MYIGKSVFCQHAAMVRFSSQISAYIVDNHIKWNNDALDYELLIKMIMITAERKSNRMEHTKDGAPKMSKLKQMPDKLTE